MIPILYPGDETSFTSNGLGRLTDIIECTCTEERNGVYEVEFTYPITGRFYKQMVSMVEALSVGNYSASGIIGCIHDDHHDIQPFDLYSVSAPIDGIVTFNAHHISYRLGGEVTEAFESGSAAGVFSLLPGKIVGGSAFTFWTDKTGSGTFKLKNPENVRNILGGQEGSVLDSFHGGEYLFDKFDVKLYQNRGANTGVTIRYGKNMVDVNRELDSSGHFNAIAPYWVGSEYNEISGESDDVLVTLSSIYVKASGITGSPVIAAIDFSSDFEEQPTETELRAKALQYLTDNKPWQPDDNITVNFVQLWQTTEYENVAVLQRLSLCDQISVYYEDLGIVANEQEIIKVVYNVIMERYDEMELGKAKSSLANSISNDTMANLNAAIENATKDAATNSMMQAAIQHATDMITGGLGGYVITTLNADGEPQEILVMNTDDPQTATNVIRINQNGIGFSTNGYNGPFSTAWTIDGAFNADYITAGTLNANIITAGVLADRAGKNSWNLTSGVLTTTSMTATDITATGTFSSTGRGTSHFNYGTEVTIKMEGGAIVGYYNNRECGRITMAASVDYADWDRGGSILYKNSMILEGSEMILIVTPTLCVRDNWYTSYQYNAGITNTFYQDIAFDLVGDGNGGITNWKYGTFHLTFINGICTGWLSQQ